MEIIAAEAQLVEALRKCLKKDPEAPALEDDIGTPVAKAGFTEDAKSAMINLHREMCGVFDM